MSVATAVPAVPVTSAGVRGSAARSIVSLAWVEGRRLFRHPIALLGFVLIAVILFGVRPPQRRDSFFMLTGGGPAGMYLPVLVFFAANMSATRARRSRATELLAAAPLDQQRRTLAACLAALVPAVGTLALVLAGLAWYRATDVFVVRTPTPAELLLLPLSVLGAGTLGVMVARWAPWRGSAAVVFAALVATTLIVYGHSPFYASYVDLLDWESLEPLPGSTSWHAAYLLGLDTMAVVGALLRDTTRRGLLLGVGAAVTLATIGAAWAQLP